MSKFQLRTIDLSYLSEGEIGYLAAMIDGEGCITRRFTNTSKLAWRVVITGTSPALSNWLLAKIGGRCDTKKVYSEKHSPSYNWVIERAADCLTILDYTWPYLVIKKAKAEQAILEITDRGIR